MKSSHYASPFPKFTPPVTPAQRESASILLRRRTIRDALTVGPVDAELPEASYFPALAWLCLDKIEVDDDLAWLAHRGVPGDRQTHIVTLLRRGASVEEAVRNLQICFLLKRQHLMTALAVMKAGLIALERERLAAAIPEAIVEAPRRRRL